MTARELLSSLAAQGVQLRLEAGELRFTAPKGALTPQLKAAIRQRREEIIRLLQSKDAPVVSEISPSPSAEHYPLSNAQRRIWILSQMEGASATYNIPLHLLIRGDLDIATLEHAFARVVDRHESLRTTVEFVEGEPRQFVGEAGDITLATTDLVGHCEDEARELAAVESARPFDLAVDRPLRARLLRISPDQHLLLCTLHHIVSDGVSIGVFFRELAAFYNEPGSGATPLPFQYRDYAIWQQKHLESGAVNRHRDYWMKQLAGPLLALDLPADASRPPAQTFSGDEIGFSLGAERSQRLRHLAREQRTSLFMVLLACFKVLLHRYTDAQDLVIGTPVAAREHPALHGQIGLYLNSLPIRTSPDGRQPFLDYLAQVRQSCLEAFEHQSYPFDRLVEELQIPRDLSRSPVFDVMMILQNQDDAVPVFDGLQIDFLPEHTGTSKVDLTLCCKDMGDEIWANLEFNTDLFHQDRVSRMGDHFGRLIDDVLDHPERTLARLQLLPDTEKAQLTAWNQTRAEYPRDQTVVDLIDASRRRYGDRPAIESSTGSVSYGEVETASNRLAQHLVALGVEPGERVALCLDRSISLVIGLLAILKTGATYVPLDPQFPAGRIRFILDDAGVRHVLSAESTWKALAALQATEGRRAILIDRDRESIDRRPPTRPDRDPQPTQACYAIYTSGSTGQPKGVIIGHQALVNFLWSMRRQPKMTEVDHLLAITTVSFDIAALELLLPLVCGARLTIASEAAVVDPAELERLLRTEGITMMQGTPATWRMLLESGWEGTPGLRILCGGEALPIDLAGRLVKAGDEVWNLYGPTETTIWSTIHRLEAATCEPDSAEESAVTIGRPIANTEVHILDANLQPVPIGIPGDLYLGGDGLALGYHDRDELTANRFIALSGRRLYRTGDVARYRADGDIEFLGRSDHQVKIRGFRVETGEVEAKLSSHPAIQQAVVIASGLGAQTRLVAYVLGEHPGTSALRQWLRNDLPDYMIPSVFMQLDALPLTPNGKIDRSALPQPELDVRAKQAPVTEPRDEFERAILAVWREVLENDVIGVLDDFFELGGHSLNATRIIFRLQREADLSVQLMDLFQYPTVETLAATIRQTGDDGVATSAGDQKGAIRQISADELALLEE